MPNFLEFLRQQNIFGPTGGIGDMRLPPPANPIPQSINRGMSGMSSGMIPTDTNLMAPPQFEMPGIYTKPSPQDPFNVSFGRGPLDINQFDLQQAGQGAADFPDVGYDAGSRMRELYQPTTDATKRFEDLINQYPQRQDPGWLRRIASMIVDYTKGSEAGRALYEGPFREKQEDWKNKIGPAQQAANLERQENVNTRTLAYQQISMELREKAQEAKEKNDIRVAEIRQHRADIYASKAANPDFKWIFPKGGNVQAFNPRTGEIKDTGVPTGSMTEIDKMNLNQEQALERIGATSAEARETEGVRQTGRLETIGARGEQARQTRTMPSGGIGEKALSPTQTTADQFNKAREIINSRPDLASFIKLGTPGPKDFEVTKPEEHWFGKTGPTPQQYSDIINAIYGQASGKKAELTAPGLETGTIRVRSKDGKTGTFKGTVAEAKAAGYTVIGQ